MHSVLALKDRNSTLFGDEQKGRGGGGGWIWHNFVHVFLHSQKKNHRDIFQHKKSRHAKFQPIRSNLENHYEIVVWGRLARSYSIERHHWPLANRKSWLRTCDSWLQTTNWRAQNSVPSAQTASCNLQLIQVATHRKSQLVSEVSEREPKSFNSLDYEQKFE